MKTRLACCLLATAAACGGGSSATQPDKPADPPEWEIRPERATKKEPPPPPAKIEAIALPATLLIGEEGGPGDELGAALVLRGDQLFAGAPGHEVGKAKAGAVHVLERQGGRWVETDRLVSSSPVAGGRFGHAVALTPSGWLFVGAPGEEDGWGKVYVFHRTPPPKGKPGPGKWTLAGALRGVVSGAGDGEVRVSGFGQILVASDDLLAVGAPATARLGGKHSQKGSITGALLTFRRADKAWQLAGHTLGQLPGYAASVALVGEQVLVDDGGAVALYGPTAGKPVARLAETGGPRLASGGDTVAMLAGGLGSQKSTHFTQLALAPAAVTRGGTTITAINEAAGAPLGVDGARALSVGETALGPAAVLLQRDAAGAWTACTPFVANPTAAADLPVDGLELRALGRAAVIDGAALALGADLDDGRGAVALFSTDEVAAACRR
jgi:hypothetical protein